MFPSIKKTLLTTLLLLVVNYYSQTQKLSDLDRVTTDYRNKGDIEGVLKFNLKELDEYKKADNIEGIVSSKINIGNALCTLNKHKESIEYLDKAKARMSKIKDPVLFARLYNEYGRNYALLGLYDQSNVNFNKSLQYSAKITDPKKKEDAVIYANSWKTYNFDYLDEVDSLYAIKYKTLKLYPNESLMYVQIAGRYIREKKHLDSAEYYLKKGVPLSKANPLHHSIAITALGDLYMTKGENQEALKYYFQILDYFKKLKNPKEVSNTYNRISMVYDSLDDKEKSKEYLQKYTTLRDSISESELKTINIAVKSFIQEKEEEKKKEENKLYVLIGAILIAAMILIYFLRRRFVKKQAKQEELIEQKSQETEKLEKQINVSFDEVMQLAKSADPFFLTRFKEVYPDFYEKLITHTPDLTEHDIRFCAYMRLNLNTKEMAQFENIAIRTVESKKYRLKKKLNLPSEVDLTKWILEL
ncbi:tetratricopeptide repeat protein [Chryseobacterium sp. MMS23-Vi53]|uniref:tetratricopeptide repeat protein n=1 Tax=Chryseobacterium sp. MMS23-Vi53 TaxID=3386644 RepID=UPI0039EAA879